ncbi:MAG: hypothetical protein NXI16_16475 [Alphaproteobacteria bacterium]|nr:hypothetical protein [Alphaproteobacteria bacterium]
MPFSVRDARINTVWWLAPVSAFIYQRGTDSVRKTVLNEVFETLVAHQLVSSESEFSKDWLGRGEGYMRGLRFHGDPPSVASIAICASKLKHYGHRLAETGEHDELSDRFIELSEACYRQIQAISEATWLGAPEKGPAAQKSERAI